MAEGRSPELGADPEPEQEPGPRPEPSQPDIADLREGFHWLREETLTTLVACAVLLTWLWFAYGVTQHWDFWPGWGQPLAVLPLFALCYPLRSRSYTLASLLFLAGLLGLALAFLSGGARSRPEPLDWSVAALVLAALVLVTGTLYGSRAAVVATGAASLLLVGARLTGAGVPPSALASGLLLIWVSGLASWATLRGLYTALHWAWSHSEQSEQRLAEAREYQGKLAAAHRQLEEANYRLERANYALSWARSEADQARRLKATFAAHVSHELRTPVNLVVGFAELMLNNRSPYTGTTLSTAYVADLHALYRNAKHLRGLIDDVLDISQLDAGEMPVLRELTEVGAIVHEAVATTGQLFKQKGLTVEASVEPDLPLLYVDRLRIRQVLLNLLNNAARFTDRGGVSVRASREREHVVVEVADTGVGIRPQDFLRLFEPFHQLDGSPTRSRGGTGLGLAISRHFVELHGGRIWAHSEGVPGRGSTFGFALPVESDEAPPWSASPGQLDRHYELPAAPPAPVVVVLDDDPGIVGLFQRHLEGYRVLGASSEAEAVETATRLRAHAVVADVPDAAGLAAWHERWLELTRSNGVRLLSCPMPSGRRVARTLGLADYLVKPVTQEALLRSVQLVAPSARTVLVVDDEPEMVRLLCGMLRAASQPYRLRRAYDAQQALEVLGRTRPDLVLLDILMPQVDGLTVLEKMKADPELAPIPVIAVSARGAVEVISPSAARTLILVDDDALPVSQLLRSVRTVLGSLPPAEASRDTSAPAPPAGPPGSAASG